MRIRFNGKTIDTIRGGEFQMSNAVSGPTPDLDFEYFIDNHNSSEIYFLEWKLTTNAPGIQESDSIFVILSPDGIGPVQRLHFQSLYLENFLGTTIDQVVYGDVNMDSSINLLDVRPFVNLINENSFRPEADINQDGVVNLADVSGFVSLLSQQ